MQAFEVLEHTADKALRVRGRDLRELVENAMRGLLALLYAESPPPPRHWVELSVAGESPEEVLHHALREMLYLLEDEDQAPVAVEVCRAEPQAAEFRVGTVPAAEVRAALAGTIKAVTYHGLQVRREGELLVTEVVFDT